MLLRKNGFDWIEYDCFHVHYCAHVNVREDVVTRSEIEGLLDAGQTLELEKRLGTRK